MTLVEMIQDLPTQKIALLIPIVAIIGVFGTAAVSAVAYQWRKARQTELEISLKSQMIERGMSAEEITQVFAAGQSDSRSRKKWRKFDVGQCAGAEKTV